MKNKDMLLKIAVIGSSSDGHRSAREILENISIPENSAIVYIPHVLALESYSILKNKKRPVEIIKGGNMLLSPGKIYMGIKNKEESLIRKEFGCREGDFGEWCYDVRRNSKGNLGFYYNWHKKILIILLITVLLIYQMFLWIL